MNKAGEALGIMFPSRKDTPEFVQPSEQALDLPASAVAAHLAPILRHSLASIAPVRVNHFDAIFGKVLIEWITVIGTTSNQSLGQAKGGTCIEGSIDKGDFTRLHMELKV